ncbi:MAG TPA: UDP-N-acetylglucosamine--N-acetylmuramyl-(pentapeptide) pyrophosphoryl-undecaprenol N-acetylglucosamine transferase [Gemmatimonadaceae bacterium]|nr:UDP-N-acetylglucosamine--N-acetylmuramyl-(pentapeptide) pyrophosphoryl-undecaprenol N-acetylglucosamine transferase [Gemmatimonadaceae bacterium]
MKVVFAGGGTGGHLYPGLAIARALVRLDDRIHPFFIGARRGVERDVLPKTEFPHLLLDLRPLDRRRPWLVGGTIASAMRAVADLDREWERAHPALVVGTGGYASAPILTWAWRRGVPFVLQEQNSEPGIVTRFFSRFAREVYLGYGEAKRRLTIRRGGWIGETGNPIQPPPVPRPSREEARRRWQFPEVGGMVLLVFGGSQGAKAINDAMAGWLDKDSPKGLYIIWATGRATHERFAHLERAAVRVLPYLSPIEHAYAAADLAVTRAGALTLAELCAWGIPSLLIPLPTAAADHQSANADALAASGAARVLSQSALTPASLGSTVLRLLASGDALATAAAAALARARPRAAEDIARRILTLLHLEQNET